MRVGFIALLAPITALPASATLEQVSAGEQCVSMFAGALTRTATSNQVSAAISTLRTSACSAANRNINAGFDSKTQSIVSGVPVVSSFMGKFGYSSNKQFCEAYDRGDFRLDTLDTFIIEPVAEAMAQANRCMEIANVTNLVLTHEVLDPGTIMFNGRFTEPQSNVRFSAATTGGFKCSSPRPNTNKVDSVGKNEILREAANFSVSCQRSPKMVNNDAQFSDGAVSLATSRAGIYTVRVPADTLFGVRSRRQAATSLEEARASSAAVATERDTIRAERDAARAELDRANKRQLTAVSWNYGQYGQDNPITGKHYSCGPWGASEQARNEVARADLCPNGTLQNIQHVEGRSGNKCGYNAFRAVCQVNP